MRFGSFPLLLLIALPPAASAAATTRTHRSSASAHKTTAKRTAKPKPVGQRGIDDVRAVQIQDALIKAGYLSGTASGHWDAAAIAAMTKVQADNGWQTKLVPDSRALIKLGLGPASASASSPSQASAPSSSLVARPEQPIPTQPSTVAQR